MYWIINVWYDKYVQVYIRTCRIRCILWIFLKVRKKLQVSNHNPFVRLRALEWKHCYIELYFKPIRKGTFYSESAGEMWNRHIKVPKIVIRFIFPVSDINCSIKMLIFTFFCVNKINREQIFIKLIINNFSNLKPL